MGAKQLILLALPSGEPNRRKIKVLTVGLPLQAFPCFLMFFLSCQNVSNKHSGYALLWNAPKYEVSFPSGRKVTVDTSRTHQELVTMVDDALRQEPPPKPGEKSHADSRDEILN